MSDSKSVLVHERASAGASPGVATTIALCFSVAVLEGFDIQAIGVAAPRLAPELGLGSGQMGWVFSISNVGLVIGAALGGRLADRVGRKPILCGAVLTFGLFTWLTALASGFELLLAARCAAGLGFGAALPNMMALAAEVSPAQRRASMASAVFCGMPLGGGISALLTQVLPPELGWRALFVAGGALPLALAPALYLWMPETLRPGASASRESRGIRRALFGDGRAFATLLLWLTFLPTLLVLYLILNWLPTLAIANGLEPSTAPRASLVFNFASVAGALLLGRAVDRLGTRWPLLLAYGALIVALVALSDARDAQRVLLWSGSAGFCLLGANYALYGVAASYYPQAVRATGSGASIAVGRVGSILGPMLAGALLSGGIPASSVMQYMAPVAAVAGLAVFLLSFAPRRE